MKCLLMIMALLLTPVICQTASAQQPQWQARQAQSQQSQQTADVVEHRHIYHHIPPSRSVSYQRFGPQLTVGGCKILGINLWESGSGTFFGCSNPNVRIMNVPVMSVSGGVWSGGFQPRFQTYGQYYGGGYRGGSYGGFNRGSGYQPRNWSHLKAMTQPYRH